MKLGQNVLDNICENVGVIKANQKFGDSTTDREADNEIMVSALDLPSE